MLNKYIKPKSITWWAGIITLASGLIMALAAGFPAFEPLAKALRAAWGIDAPALLFTLGLGLVGVRGAIGAGK